MSLKVMGIDNGLDGGIVVLSQVNEMTTAVSYKAAMPTIGGTQGKRLYDIDILASIFLEQKPDLTILEKAQAFPGQGVTSMFSIGLGFGIMQGLLTGLRLPFMIVTPQAWQKLMFAGLPKQDTKAMSYVVAQRTWPGMDWRLTEKCKKPHDGMLDAAMLALFGFHTAPSRGGTESGRTGQGKAPDTAGTDHDAGRPADAQCDTGAESGPDGDSWARRIADLSAES